MQLLVIACLFLTAPLFAQYGYPQYPSAPWEARKTAPGAVPMPSFTGKVTDLDSKKLTLEGDTPNLMEFNLMRKTEYFSGKAKIKANAIKAGDRVTVETRKAPDGTLDAVIVRLEKSPPKRDQ